jgi:hypothetical protein
MFVKYWIAMKPLKKNSKKNKILDIFSQESIFIDMARGVSFSKIKKQGR